LNIVSRLFRKFVVLSIQYTVLGGGAKLTGGGMT